MATNGCGEGPMGGKSFSLLVKLTGAGIGDERQWLSSVPEAR